MKPEVEKTNNNPTVYIPTNEVFKEHGDLDVVALLRRYKDDPVAILFIADMLEA